MNLLQRIQRRLRINRSIRELSRLDNSILLDIGIERGNIAEIVEASVDSKYVQTTNAGPVVHGNVSNDYHVPGGAAA
jgi:uncharacterized protein YjiS (DUF1127 family)